MTRAFGEKCRGGNQKHLVTLEMFLFTCESGYLHRLLTIVIRRFVEGATRCKRRVEKCFPLIYCPAALWEPVEGADGGARWSGRLYPSRRRDTRVTNGGRGSQSETSQER